MAGYNNYFPQNYNGNIYSTTPTLTTQSYSTNSLANGINWVQGEAGARSFPVSAGQKVLLMDSESNVFYVKSSDMSGMPLPLRTFEYKEINAEGAPSISAPDYVTKEEFEKAITDLKKSFKEKKRNEQFDI